jgi:Protein-L-isoaspartate carboxylmethyltransferase
VSYGKQISEDGSLREAVTGFMAGEGLLTPADDVLEIGCGPGVYTLPMARTARSVTALDISQGMLDQLTIETNGKGITNVRPVCSGWDSYRGRKKYDLVFPRSVLASTTRRHCSRWNDILGGAAAM